MSNPHPAKKSKKGKTGRIVISLANMKAMYISTLRNSWNDHVTIAAVSSLPSPQTV
jgi:hypothetical protein